LTKIAGKNILEILSINVYFWSELDWDEIDIGTMDDWDMLDEVLTSSGWPTLKMVALEIVTENGSNEWPGQLEQLKKEKFPRLSESKSLDFRFRIK